MTATGMPVEAPNAPARDFSQALDYELFADLRDVLGCLHEFTGLLFAVACNDSSAPVYESLPSCMLSDALDKHDTVEDLLSEIERRYNAAHQAGTSHKEASTA